MMFILFVYYFLCKIIELYRDEFSVRMKFCVWDRQTVFSPVLRCFVTSDQDPPAVVRISGGGATLLAGIQSSGRAEGLLLLLQEHFGKVSLVVFPVLGVLQPAALQHRLGSGLRTVPDVHARRWKKKRVELRAGSWNLSAGLRLHPLSALGGAGSNAGARLDSSDEVLEVGPGASLSAARRGVGRESGVGTRTPETRPDACLLVSRMDRRLFLALGFLRESSWINCLRNILRR